MDEQELKAEEARSHEQYRDAIAQGWRWPVEQLGLFELDKAAWMVEVVTDHYMRGVPNTQTATVLRTYGGVMTKEEKTERGLKPTARLGVAFYDALTPAGQTDPVMASRAVVSRITRTGVWVGDILTWKQTQQTLIDMGKNPSDLTGVIFHRGPRCCQWAYDNDGRLLQEAVQLPVDVCDKPFCSCRAVWRPIPKDHSGCAPLVVGTLFIIAIIVALYFLFT